MCYNAVHHQKERRASAPAAHKREVFIMAHTTREQHTRMLCTAGLMAALACVSNFISIAT